MAINRVKQIWREGGTAFGAWLSIPSTLSAQVLSHAGYDYICLDLQHGLIDDAAAAEMLLAISTTDATPFVRVPANDFAAINRVLDAGALGVVVPLVQTSDDAHRAASACRYPPNGTRSYGPVRAALAHGPDYFAQANDLVAIVPMIETRQAAEEIDSIASLPGVDAVYVGPNDLSLAFGQAPAPDNDGAYKRAYHAVAESCATHGIAAGIHGNADLSQKHMASGYRMITVSSDVGLLRRGAAGDLALAKQD